jgi:hypothetical protein
VHMEDRYLVSSLPVLPAAQLVAVQPLSAADMVEVEGSEVEADAEVEVPAMSGVTNRHEHRG